jgi:hypothetical protein
MFKPLFGSRTTVTSLLGLACLLLSGPTIAELAQDSPPDPVFLFEVQAALVENTQPYAFQVWGDKEKESYTAYGIQVVAPNGSTQLLTEFESILPVDSEADALVVEDVNFDGYADVRIMEARRSPTSTGFTAPRTGPSCEPRPTRRSRAPWSTPPPGT